MPLCFFATDFHGSSDKYEKLYTEIVNKKPDAVFIGGDLLPSGFGINSDYTDFFQDFMLPLFIKLKQEMANHYPAVFLILGNDDPRVNEPDFIKAQSVGVWTYAHENKIVFMGYTIYGYAYVPPTPFMLKDWERYDVSRYVDPGCIHPNEGYFSMDPKTNIEFQTISNDLNMLTDGEDLSNAIMLFHSPPYQTHLDRAALDGIIIDYVPLDLHVGSIAIKRFIEERNPLITLHGHIHESSRITGHWNDQIGRTLALGAAWDGPELSLIIFDPERGNDAERYLI
jgi:Icc-related predicted phosphoesterase